MAGVKGMKTGGANKKSVAQLKLEGTYHVTRHRNSDIQNPAPTSPEPYILGKTLTPSEVYEHVSQQLLDLGVTEDVDGPWVSQIVAQYILLQDAYKLYLDGGPDQKIGGKSISSMITESQRELRILYTMFRASPGERTPQDAAEQDPVEALMAFDVSKT